MGGSRFASLGQGGGLAATMTTTFNKKDNTLLAVIGDEDTITGFMLAGVGDINAKKEANTLVVTNRTSIQTIEESFKAFMKRKDISIILINQHIADMIRHILQDNEALIPTVLEIPSKEHPYGAEKDSVMLRIMKGMSY